MTSTHRPSTQPAAVAAGRLWAGGLATALVAALTAVVGVLIATGILDVEVLGPPGFTDSEAANYAIAAAVAALLATALIHLLIISTPRPFAYFHWIMGLLILAATLIPFASTSALSTNVATAAINLVVGIAIASLTSGTASRVVRRAARAPGEGLA
jgi:Family of unknown function (DUF6069)